jgi:predicted metal-dependent HD superfamily phosphohydrolase
MINISSEQLARSLELDRSRFEALWLANVGPQAPCAALEVFERLDRLYASAGRSYHNAEHITFVLCCFDRYRDQARDPDAVEFAIWFHDACYGPDPAGHEARSARLFLEVTGDGIDPERAQFICDLILSTTHLADPVCSDHALLVDVDLASFARPWHSFLIDTARCRAEKKRLPDLEFCYCQIGFLKALLERPRLFYSRAFFENHEQQARSNIRRLIELLERRSDRLS